MTNSSDAFETSSPSGLPEGSDRVTEDGLIEAIPHRPINMAAGTIGHFVEWYDWYIYGLLAAVSRDKYSQATHASHPLSPRCSLTQSGLSSAHSAESSSVHWPTALADEPSSRCPSPGWQWAP